MGYYLGADMATAHLLLGTNSLNWESWEEASYSWQASKHFEGKPESTLLGDQDYLLVDQDVRS
jgi:hypothetical protein